MTKTLRITGTLVLALTLIPATLSCQAKQSISPVEAATELAPTELQGQTERVIAGLLSNYHYSHGKLDNELSSSILDGYLDLLDPNRVYFLSGDVNRFEKYRYQLDESFRVGDLDPAYSVFNVYRERISNRTEAVRRMLAQDMDFTIDESFDINRADADWPDDWGAMDEIWRKRLKSELLNLMLAGQDYADARETLLTRYEGRERRTAQTTEEDVFQLYMNAASGSFDPHTSYLSPRTSENFNIQMRLSLEGIGAVLRMEDEQTTIVSLVPGGPADLSKQLKPDDVINGVAQGDDGAIVDVIGWRLDDVVDKIRGPRESVVRLQVVSGDAGSKAVPRIVRLVRNKIQLEEQAAKAEVKEITEGGRSHKIGVITIPTFYIDFEAAQRGDPDYRSTTRDVRNLLADMKNEGVSGIVIDLRQNGGGSLQEAVQLSGLFIPEGPVVQVRDSKGEVDVEIDPDPSQAYSGPMGVLVDRFSASASEIFASAIQDYGRGIVIGEATFGKGTVQTLIDLTRFISRSDEDNPSGRLKLTIAKFYRINGSSTQHRGVLPDVAFPSAFDADEVGESAETHALPWDEIQATEFVPQGELGGIIPQLNGLHLARRVSDPALKELLADLESGRIAREQTLVSLMQSKRKAELDESSQKRRGRENRLRIARGLQPLSEDEEVPAGEETPDMFLEESARVVADLVSLLERQASAADYVATQ